MFIHLLFGETTFIWQGEQIIMIIFGEAFSYMSDRKSKVLRLHRITQQSELKHPGPHPENDLVGEAHESASLITLQVIMMLWECGPHIE